MVLKEGSPPSIQHPHTTTQLSLNYQNFKQHKHNVQVNGPKVLKIHLQGAA
jgi:hypothetical protein